MSRGQVHTGRAVSRSRPQPRELTRELVAVAGGLALPFAFSPYELWPAALAAPALLYWACLEGSLRRLAGRGALFGLASFGVGVFWIHESFQFSNVALPFAIALTVGFVLFLSVYPALACAAFALLCPTPLRTRFAAAAAFAGLYVLAEWLRGWLLSGFTWLQLGYTQVDGPLGPLLAICGVYGTGLLLAVAACCTLAAWRAGLRCLALSVSFFIAGAALLLFVLPPSWTRPDGQALGVAIIQGNVPQDQKWLPAMRASTLDRYRELTGSNLGEALVVWPETAIPAVRDRVRPFLEQLSRQASARGSSVLVGLPEVDRASGQAFNSIELLGRSTGLYRKRHLVPFGEFLPLSGLLRPITRALNIPVSSFSPGAASQPLLSVQGHPVAAFICYEIAFGSEVAASLPAARLLVTVSNDAWFGDSLGPLQHLQMARARAMETGRYLVRATNTGLSAVVNPHGEVILELPQFQVAHGATQVLPMAGATPYVRGGDLPVLILCVLAVLWGRVRAGRSRRSQVRS